MAEEGKRGRRGHPIKGSNRAGQLRALYAKGVLSGGKGHGRGGKRGGYHPERGRALGRYAKASKSAAAGGNLGRNVPRGTQKAAARRALGHNHNTNAAKSHPSLAKSGIGMKAAHLRGGGSGRRIPSKAERDATRASRIAAGHDAAVLGVARAAQRHDAGSRAANEARRGIALAASSSAQSRADGLRATRASARLTQAKKRQDKLNERRDRITNARQLANQNPRAQKFEAMKDRLGRDGALKALHDRPARIAAGKARYAEFVARRDAAHGGGLFSGSGGSRVDHSATRADRIAAGKAARARFGESKRGKEITRTIAKINENNAKIDEGLRYWASPAATRVPKLLERNRKLVKDARLPSGAVAKLLARYNR